MAYIFANLFGVWRIKDGWILLSASAAHLSQCVVLNGGFEETWPHTDLLRPGIIVDIPPGCHAQLDPWWVLKVVAIWNLLSGRRRYWGLNSGPHDC
jgi:hypothetical protein